MVAASQMLKWLLELNNEKKHQDSDNVFLILLCTFLSLSHFLGFVAICGLAFLFWTNYLWFDSTHKGVN